MDMNKVMILAVIDNRMKSKMNYCKFIKMHLQLSYPVLLINIAYNMIYGISSKIHL